MVLDVDRLDLTEIRALFDAAPGTAYLDSATYGLPPRPTVTVMHRAIDDWQTGAANWVTAWDQQGEVCRRAFGTLIGAPATSVALMPSVSVGVATIASVLRSHDEVVIADDEFTSVLNPVLVAAQARGVTVRSVPFDGLADAVRSSTTLVAFSLVQSQSGRVARQMDIIDAARRVGARTLVDATHALPFLSVDPRADFVACAAYKHLLCPRGVAFLSVAGEHWDSIPPLLANWRSMRDPYGVHYGGDLDLAADAARFDVSLAWFSWAGAASSLELLLTWQRAGALAPAVDQATRLARRLDLEPTGSSIIGVPIADAGAALAELSQAGIKAAVRAGSVRLSTHVYTTDEHIDRAVTTLRRHQSRPA